MLTCLLLWICLLIDTSATANPSIEGISIDHGADNRDVLNSRDRRNISQPFMDGGSLETVDIHHAVHPSAIGSRQIIRTGSTNIASTNSIPQPLPAQIFVLAYGDVSIYVNGVLKKKVTRATPKLEVTTGSMGSIKLKGGDVVGVVLKRHRGRRGALISITLHSGSTEYYSWTVGRKQWRASTKFHNGWNTDRFGTCQWPSVVATMRREKRKLGKARYVTARRARRRSTIYIRHVLGSKACTRWFGEKIRHRANEQRPLTAIIRLFINGNANVYVNGHLVGKTSMRRKRIVLGRRRKLEVMPGDVVGIEATNSRGTGRVRGWIRFRAPRIAGEDRRRSRYRVVTSSRSGFWRASTKYEPEWNKRRFQKCWPVPIQILRWRRRRRRRLGRPEYIWAKGSSRESTVYMRYVVGRKPCIVAAARNYS